MVLTLGSTKDSSMLTSMGIPLTARGVNILLAIGHGCCIVIPDTVIGIIDTNDDLTVIFDSG